MEKAEILAAEIASEALVEIVGNFSGIFPRIFLQKKSSGIPPILPPRVSPQSSDSSKISVNVLEKQPPRVLSRNFPKTRPEIP